jgi:hypothetical protein
MLDLPPAQAPPMPPHWRLAPMPDAPLCLAQPRRLLDQGGHQALAASPALLAALAAPVETGTTLAAYDSSGAAWRLRHAGFDTSQPLWRVQALADSRAGLFAALRGLLGRQLAGGLLHELRGPLNALSLHGDLIERMASSGEPAASAPRILNSAGVMRERLRELSRRQDALVALWLGEPASGGAGLRQLVDESLRLLRGHLSLQEVRLRGDGLDCIGEACIAGGAAAAQLALFALLLGACAGARHNRVAAGEAEVLFVATLEDRILTLELQAPYEFQALGRELAGTDSAGLLAALALLLEPAGLRLEASPELALTRLSLRLA